VGETLGNMNMNPLSALTRCGTSKMLSCPDVRELCIRMMEEMQSCAQHLGLEMNITPAERIAVTQRLGDFRTSMLADVEAGRPLEFRPADRRPSRRLRSASTFRHRSCARSSGSPGCSARRMQPTVRDGGGR